MGDTLESCYQACATVAKRWMNILWTKGEGLENEELFSFIGQTKSLSKEIEEYGSKKMIAVVGVKRMAEFLGKDLLSGKGITCNFIISKRPYEEKVTGRAVPIAIFETDKAIQRKFLKKWLKVDN